MVFRRHLRLVQCFKVRCQVVNALSVQKLVTIIRTQTGLTDRYTQTGINYCINVTTALLISTPECSFKSVPTANYTENIST